MIRIADEQVHELRAALSYARRLAHNEACTRGSGDSLYEPQAAIVEKRLEEAIAVVDSAILAREPDPETASEIAVLESIIVNCQDRISRLLGASRRHASIGELAVLADRRDRAQRAVEEMRSGR